MNTDLFYRTKREGYIQLSTLLLIAFASAFFPRLLNTLGFPAFINFIHFGVVPIIVVITLNNTKTKNRSQIATTLTILFGLYILLGVMLVSALVNQAGLINVVMEFLLLGEPFIFLLAINIIQLSPKSLAKMQTWLLRFLFINLFLAYLQHYLIIPYFYSYVTRVTSLRLPPDLVQGVFFASGGGNTLSASISIFFGVYYFLEKYHKVPLWQRVALILACIWQVVISDSKTVIFVVVLAWCLLSLTKVKDIKKLILSILCLVSVTFVFVWCAQNLAEFSSFKTYLDPKWYDLNSHTMQIKLASVKLIPQYYKSPLNVLLGLGPGHTVGRLGGWMLKNYDYLLAPLGSTIHPVSQAVWDKFQSLAYDDIGSISTFFSPFWGWSGIWGDLGIVGLLAYIYLGYLVWQKMCKDDFSKFMLLNLVIFGFIFTQLEEPGYTLSIAMMIGLRRHENKLANEQIY